jgi:hypothetical protein
VLQSGRILFLSLIHQLVWYLIYPAKTTKMAWTLNLHPLHCALACVSLDFNDRTAIAELTLDPLPISPRAEQ